MQSLDSDVCCYRVDNKEVCALDYFVFDYFTQVMTLSVFFSIFWGRKENELKKCSTAHSSLICPPPESGSISGICYANVDFYSFNSSINCKVKRWNDNVRTYKRTTFKLSSLQQTSILQFTLNFWSKTTQVFLAVWLSFRRNSFAVYFK